MVNSLASNSPGTRRRKLSPATESEMVSEYLNGDGISVQAIAAKYDVSRPTVYAAVARYRAAAAESELAPDTKKALAGSSASSPGSGDSNSTTTKESA